MSIVEPDGFVYVKTRIRMYSLKQAACIAFNHLVTLMKPHGYAPLRYNPGIWRHEKLDIIFTLCIDNFGIKYWNLDDANHLLNTLQRYYKISIDCSGTQYCGLILDWNYLKRYVGVSRPGYVPKALHKIQHPHPKQPQYAPHEWTKPAYAQRIQYSTALKDLPLLDQKGAIWVQSIHETFWYYARAVDPTPSQLPRPWRNATGSWTMQQRNQELQSDIMQVIWSCMLIRTLHTLFFHRPEAERLDTIFEQPSSTIRSPETNCQWTNPYRVSKNQERCLFCR